LNTFYFAWNPLIEDQPQSAVLAVERVRSAFAAGAALWPQPWTVQVQGSVDVIEDSTGELVDQLTVATPAIVGGSSAGGFGPTATGVLLRLNTAGIAGGRRLKGRAFLSPVINHADADGTPSAADLVAAQSFGTALDAQGATGTSLRVWSRPRPARAATADLPAQAARAGSSSDVTGTTAADKYAVLRSRRD